MPTMPKSAEGFKFILVTVFMDIRTKVWHFDRTEPGPAPPRSIVGGAVSLQIVLLLI